jgi:sulfur-carrier protein
MAKVLIPTPLRQFAEKHDAVELTGASVGEVLAALVTRFPDLRKQLFNDEGRLRSFVNVYLNDEDIRYLKKDATPVASGDTLSIVPSIAGGAIPAEPSSRDRRERFSGRVLQHVEVEPLPATRRRARIASPGGKLDLMFLGGAEWQPQSLRSLS